MIHQISSRYEVCAVNHQMPSLCEFCAMIHQMSSLCGVCRFPSNVLFIWLSQNKTLYDFSVLASMLHIFIHLILLDFLKIKTIFFNKKGLYFPCEPSDCLRKLQHIFLKRENHFNWSVSGFSSCISAILDIKHFHLDLG